MAIEAGLFHEEENDEADAADDRGPVQRPFPTLTVVDEAGNSRSYKLLPNSLNA